MMDARALLRPLMARFWQAYAFCKLGQRVHAFGRFRVGNRRNIVLGPDCAINPDVYLAGAHDIRVGRNVVFSIGCKVIDTGLDVDRFLEVDHPPHVSKAIVIEDDVWIGAAAIILSGVTIGRKSVVAAGAIVTRDVPPYTLVAGNPARVIRRLDA